MPRPEGSSPESLDSFVAEQVSTGETPDNTPPLFSQEYRQWNNEEILRIYRELRNLTISRVFNITDAEDLVQDTLLTMICSCPKKELEKGPLVWSMGVLRNKIGNYYRKGRCRAKHEAGETKIRKELFQVRTAVSPDKDLLNGELRSVIVDTIESFPPIQKTAIKLLIAGLSPKEIAKTMQPERYQTVINNLHRGRKKLAQELIQHGFSGMHTMKRAPKGKKRPPAAAVGDH